ncbi:MAG: hypothetical protein K0R38_2868 [Polyangiaceae bacterium]|jgi:predicted transposase/invertase (TIGR01784 family)|nr:hypothetical protein [Polyangiaceae bacterium]
MTEIARDQKLPTLDPKLDVVFTFLFGAERNRHLLVALLESVLRPVAPIASIDLLPPRPDVEDVDEKSVFLDLRIRLDSGEQVDVEMQTRRHPALRERVLFYWARLYTSQLHHRDRYPSLQRCIVILIANFIELDGPEFHSVFQVLDRKRQRLFSPTLELHLLELPKLSNLAPADEPQLAAWCRFLSADTDEQREILAMQHSFLKDAKQALDDLSADPQVREAAIRRELELHLREYDKAVTRQQGLDEGRQQGLAEGMRRSLARLLVLKFGPCTTEAQDRLQNATPEELELWLERAVAATTLESVFH